jgi:hypothetical protein
MLHVMPREVRTKGETAIAMDQAVSFAITSSETSKLE